MNTINVAIDFTNGTNRVSGISLITGDYASTKIVFQFDREDGTKVFELKNPSGETRYVGEIVNNEVILTGVDDGTNYSIFNEAGLYIYEVSLYDGDSKLTSAKGQLPVKKEQVIVGDETIEPYLPIFDQLMQQINTAITETNNLNITAEKVDHTTTIEITNKQGETETIQILDGEKGDKGDKGDAGAIKMLIVAELPATGADDTIYLVPITPDTTGNNYAEYIYINGAWELLGKIGVQVDLSGYVKFTDYATSSKGGVIKVNQSVGTAVGETGNLYALSDVYSNYLNRSVGFIIGKGTLENVITGKGLVSNTDYASDSVGGVIKTNWGSGTYMSNGALASRVVDYNSYQQLGTSTFISKGTLDNVLTATIGNIQTLLDNLDSGSGV